MPSPFILIAPVGRNDVQVVHEVAGRWARFPLANRSILEFHQDCLPSSDGSCRVAWTMLSLDETLPLSAEKSMHLDYDRENGRLVAPRREEARNDLEQGGWQITSGSSGSGVTLCAPILADVWTHIRQLRKRDDSQLGEPLFVLLLNTGRQVPDREEPVAVGTVVRGRLAEAFGLPADCVQELNYLKGGIFLEQDAFGQQHLSLDAARCIDQTMQKLRELFADQNPRLIIADTAGQAEVKPVLAAAARYRFRASSLLFIRPQDRPELQPNVSRPCVQIPPDESLETRRRVLALVRHGAFDAAARLALPNDGARYDSEPWREWLGFVARVLDGNDGRVKTFFTDQRDVSEIGRVLKRLVNSGPAFAQAFQLEAALKLEDWPQAISGTVTMLESSRIALIDRVCSLPGKHCVGKRQLYLPDQMKPEFQQVFNGVAKEYEAQKKKLRELIGRFPNDIAQPIRDYGNAIKRQVKGSSLQTIRNTLLHAFLEPWMIQQAQELAIDRGLWIEQPDGLSALHAPLVSELLRTVDPEIADPARLYDDLIEAILHDMDAFSFQS